MGIHHKRTVEARIRRREDQIRQGWERRTRLVANGEHAKAVLQARWCATEAALLDADRQELVRIEREERG